LAVLAGADEFVQEDTMVQVLSFWARLCLIATLASLCAAILVGWVATGSLRLAAWASWFLWVVWANPLLRVVILVSLAVEFWNHVTLSKVWS